MNIAPELQLRFDDAFCRIMKQTPAELQTTWNGNIEWEDGKMYPKIQAEVIQSLPPAAKAAYVSLLNKLSRGSI